MFRKPRFRQNERTGYKPAGRKHTICRQGSRQHDRFVRAYGLLNSILETHPHANAATVYRTLGFLTENGLAHRLATVNGYVACTGTTGNDYRLFARIGRTDTF